MVFFVLLHFGFRFFVLFEYEKKMFCPTWVEQILVLVFFLFLFFPAVKHEFFVFLSFLA